MKNTTLLTLTNPKGLKGEKKGFFTIMLHLAPASLSGWNVCPMATDGCRIACLNTAGRGGMFKRGETTNAIQKARIARTAHFFNDRAGFMAQLVKELQKAIKLAYKNSLTPVIRLNGTSDIRWETVELTHEGVTYANIMKLFHNIQFYDYTKIANRKFLPSNYHLTFSLAESNMESARIALENGMNVAAVFRKVPATFLGRDVISGDDTDLRFLDPVGVIVGLKAKGKAKKDTSGFVYN